MPLEETRTALSTLGELTGSVQTGLWVNRHGGLGLNPGFASGRLNAVVLARPYAQDVVLYRDIDVFGLPALEVVERLRRHTQVIEDEDDDASYVAPDLLLALWRSCASHDDPDDVQGFYFNSVLIARPGYYDTPAEAAARAAAAHEI